MKSLARVLALLLSIILILPTLVSCGLLELVPDFLLPEPEPDSYAELHTTVSVSVAEGKHFEIKSQNPLRVVKGEDARFEIEIDDKYHFESCTGGAVYRDGVLTLTDVRYPTTIEFRVEKSATIVLPGEGDDDDENEPEPEPEIEYDLVELSAEPQEGYRFLCWTLDIPLTEGGDVLSEVQSGSINVPKGREPVANYCDTGHYVILYRTNGGVTADGKNYYYQTFSNAHYAMPNTIHQNGTFTREGYALLRYTENKDGTGDYTTLGGKIMPSANGFRELWLQWGKESYTGMSFSTFTNDEGDVAAYVSYYSGRDETVVIPSYITTTDGRLRVERIAAGAFDRVQTSALVLPSTLRTIDDGAFVDCPTLTELTLHDNIEYMKDAAFVGCNSLSTVYLNAGRAPMGSGEALFVQRYERLRTLDLAGEDVLLIISGSSSLYGFSAKQATELLGGRYSVVNYGTNASYCATFMMEAMTRFLDEGDIVIQAPETTNSAQMGESVFNFRIFRGFEFMYEAFSYVDMTGYKGFFDSLYEFNQSTRKGQPERTYEYWTSFINEYTDMSGNVENPGYVSASKNLNPFNLGNVTDARAERLNARYDAISERGAKVYLSFAPINEDACIAAALSRSEQDAFVSLLSSKLHCAVISHPSDYLLDQSLFNNSDYHPGPTGAAMRTERLIRDLKAQLEREGLWESTDGVGQTEDNQ